MNHVPSASASSVPGLPPADEPVYMGLPHERYLRPRLYVAAALAVPVLVLAMGGMVWPVNIRRDQ